MRRRAGLRNGMDGLSPVYQQINTKDRGQCAVSIQVYSLYGVLSVSNNEITFWRYLLDVDLWGSLLLDCRIPRVMRYLFKQ